MIIASRTIQGAASLLLLAASALTLSACASHRPTPSPAATANTALRLTRSELQDSSYANLYELILARRPMWLASRTLDRGAQINEVQIVLDNQRLASVNDLRSVSPSAIHTVFYMDPVRRRGSRTGREASDAGLIVIQTVNVSARIGQ